MDTTFARSGNIRLETAAETQAFAEELGSHLEAGDVIILDGPSAQVKPPSPKG